MRFIKHLAVGAAALLLSGAALAIELAGVKVDDNLTLGATKLQLNGAGIRHFGPVKLYVGDLYATKKVSTLDELAAAPGPKRLSMHFLREMEAGPFGKLLTRGVEDNVSKAEMSKLIPGLIRMSDIFTVNKVLVPGDVITLDWIPGTGTVSSLNGKQIGESMPDIAFYNAVLRIWLGDNPVQNDLKRGLLGEK